MRPRSASFPRRLLGEFPKRFTGQSKDAPIRSGSRAEGLIKANGRFVPVEDDPVDVGAVSLEGDRCQAGEQGAADAVPAEGWADEEVFEIKSGPGVKGGVIMKKEGVTGGRAVDGGNKDLRGGPGAKERLAKFLLGRGHFVQKTFKLGEFTNKGVDERDIALDGGSDGNG